MSLEILEAKEAIREVIDGFANLECNVPAQMVYFTEDVHVMVYVGDKLTMDIHGRDTLEKQFSAFTGGIKASHHQNGQQVITLDGDTATDVHYCRAALVMEENGHDVVSDNYIRYTDKLVKQDGKWLIKEREQHFVITKKQAREKVEKEGVYYANHVYNPFFYEGTKTYIYETYEQLGRIPEHIFVPVGNGTLFIGVLKGLEELLASGAIDHMPQVVAVQSELCQPFIKAMKAGAADITAEPVQRTMAEGIAIGLPMRSAEILAYVYKYKVQGITIPEEKILSAREKIARQGIYCEHTTAAVYAGYEHYCETYGRPQEALLSMCGAGLKSDHA